MVYNVVITAEGYETFRGQLEKELKVGAAVGGILIFPFLLWCYGPTPYQYFELRK